GTGIFAILIIVLVAGIGGVLSIDAWIASRKFGWPLLQDAMRRDGGAREWRPCIWVTLYSSVLALLIAAPIALGIAIYISELSPAWLRRPLVFLTELLRSEEHTSELQ